MVERIAYPKFSDGLGPCPIPPPPELRAGP